MTESPKCNTCGWTAKNWSTALLLHATGTCNECKAKELARLRQEDR